MAEFKGKTKHKTTGKKGQTDFYVIIDYKKMRGVKFCDMEDGDGDKCDCIVIPLLRTMYRERWLRQDISTATDILPLLLVMSCLILPRYLMHRLSLKTLRHIPICLRTQLIIQSRVSPLTR